MPNTTSCGGLRALTQTCRRFLINHTLRVCNQLGPLKRLRALLIYYFHNKARELTIEALVKVIFIMMVLARTEREGDLTAACLGFEIYAHILLCRRDTKTTLDIGFIPSIDGEASRRYS